MLALLVSITRVPLVVIGLELFIRNCIEDIVFIKIINELILYIFYFQNLILLLVDLVDYKVDLVVSSVDIKLFFFLLVIYRILSVFSGDNLGEAKLGA